MHIMISDVMVNISSLQWRGLGASLSVVIIATYVLIVAVSLAAS